jgi:hypothetical protein
MRDGFMPANDEMAPERFTPNLSLAHHKPKEIPMLKHNASYSKKVPTDAKFSSSCFRVR